MTKTEALIGLNLMTAIGSNRLKRLLEYFSEPQDIILASSGELKKVRGIGDIIVRQINNLKSEDIDKELKLIKKYDLNILTIYDNEYPENLKKIYDPPLVLYTKGRLFTQDKFSIAIVGSRRASFYGLTNAEKLAYELASIGLTVVSGLACGIDTQAHRGALRAKGRTIAVLGNGLANIYPAQNEKLSEQIFENGAVISEFPVSTKPLRENFPRRNRVISGLSLGVVVVEAGRNSGALITSDFALEQGREVFALPGEIDSETSFGTNELIKQGAKLVSTIEDILVELKLEIASSVSFANGKDKTNSERLQALPLSLTKQGNLSRGELSAEESVLYNALTKQPVRLDDIVDRTKLDISKALDILLRLEMKKLIYQLPGKQFVRN